MARRETVEIEEGQATLRRIIATLLALALLAERLRNVPGPVRRLVLWILRPAEAIVRDYLIEEFGAAPDPSAPFFAGYGDSAADAIRLALSFRALAAALDVLAMEESHACRPVDPAGRLAHTLNRAGRRLGDLVASRIGPIWLAPKALDTS